jgi:hypothetical protein
LPVSNNAFTFPEDYEKINERNDCQGTTMRFTLMAMRLALGTGLSAVMLGGACQASATPANPALRLELLKMMELDQQQRNAGQSIDPAAMSAVDAANRKRLKEIISKHGYPTTAMVGADGTQAAWLIVQHADEDKQFQKAMLPTIEKLSVAGAVPRKQFAYLYDRTHQPQRFGTQGRCTGEGRWEPDAVEDQANLNKLRAEVGLSTLEEYAALASAMLCKKKSP